MTCLQPGGKPITVPFITSRKHLLCVMALVEVEACFLDYKTPWGFPSRYRIGILNVDLLKCKHDIDSLGLETQHPTKAVGSSVSGSLESKGKVES